MKPKLLLLLTLLGASMLTGCCDTPYGYNCEAPSCYRPRYVDRACYPPPPPPRYWYPAEQRCYD